VSFHDVTEPEGATPSPQRPNGPNHSISASHSLFP